MANEPTIALAETPARIARCSPVMRQLRPQVTESEFVARVEAQQRGGFFLAFLELDQEVRAVAGFRIFDLLFSGKTLYVDDLVTRDTDRGKGFGAALFEWVRQYAIKTGCESLSLDSGVHRFPAHRFYLKRGMDLTAHHFVMSLKDD